VRGYIDIYDTETSSKRITDIEWLNSAPCSIKYGVIVVGELPNSLVRSMRSKWILGDLTCFAIVCASAIVFETFDGISV
jgi:hypothetical protein